MSLILDALNRADRERNEQALTPDLQAAPVTATAANGTPLWWLQLGLVAAVLAISAWLWLSAPTPSQPTAAPPMPQAAPTPTSDPAPATGGAARAEPARTPATTAQPGTTGAATATAAAIPAAPQDNAAVARLYRQQRQDPAPALEPKASKPAAPVKPPPTAAPAIDPGRAILQSIPLLAAMPPGFQKLIPSIEYSVHVYNDEDGSGVVNLNGAMRRVGAELAPGLRVIAILPDSVVLDFQGTQFRLLALNSWMNFQ